MPGRRLARLLLEGERARLRPHRSDDDGPAYALLAGRQEILRWLVWDGPRAVEELREYYGHWRFDAGGGSDFRLAIEERASGELAGSISVRFGGHAGTGDVGYWVGMPFQGRGLGGEALELVAHLAFRHLAADALVAWVFVGNAGSRRVLERTGFTLARSVPGRVLKQGRRVDEWHFVLLREEWRRLRSDFRPAREEIEWEEAPDPLDSPARPFPAG